MVPVLLGYSTDTRKNFSKIFEKPLDKYIPLWYNKNTIREPNSLKRRK
jgi:hypothetical protein